MRARSWFVVLAVGAVVAGSRAAAVRAAAAAPVPATGGPGALSHFDLARKDCLGTARNTTSKIWYTVADGVLSDVYAPTIDTTNVETMQYLVTDGSSFTDLQTRDTTYTVSADSTGMVCTVTSTAKTGAYRLTTTYLTDPARPSVVVQTSYTPLTPAAASYRVYVRLDATVGGNGGGGSGNGGADNAGVRTPNGSPGSGSYDTKNKTNAAHHGSAVPRCPALRAAAVNDCDVSASVVKASEDKTFPGAIVASIASPWGQAVSAGDPANTYFGSYREVFSRDLYEAWTGLLTDGDLATARAATRFLLEKQQLPDGSLPRNSLVNGKLAPDSFNTQLDEVAYPILMVLQSGLAGDAGLWPHVQAAANYLIAHGPSFGPERWEEQSGYSPSTIAAEIAGLVAAATIAPQHASPADARISLATADQYQL